MRNYINRLSLFHEDKKHTIDNQVKVVTLTENYQITILLVKCLSYVLLLKYLLMLFFNLLFDLGKKIQIFLISNITTPYIKNGFVHLSHKSKYSNFTYKNYGLDSLLDPVS